MMKEDSIQQVKQRFGIIGNDPTLNRAIDVAMQVAPTDLSVLITGESGVGKENFPQIIHQNSPRKHGAYIAVNCGAIPEGTIDSELFGHEKGSFTGALADRKGYFEVADGGTIFLDEVGELPIPTQARLLRVLESGEFIKVGSSKVLKTNVRINTVPIVVPPLRDRGNDILLLFRKFASDAAEKYRMPPIRLADEARQLLTTYRWPGNVRELKNVTERLSILEPDRTISADRLRTYLPNIDTTHLPVPVSRPQDDGKIFTSEREKKDVTELKKLVHDIMTGATPSAVPVEPAPSMTYAPKPHPLHEEPIQEAVTVDEPLALDEVERQLVQRALERHGGRRKYAAADLKISERTLYRKIKEYGLE